MEGTGGVTPVRRVGLLLVVVIVLAVAASAEAQMYRWTDQQGQVHYSEGLGSVPEGSRSTAQPILNPTPTPSAESPEPAAAPPGIQKIPFKPGSPITVSAKVNGGGPVTLILDTGADTTVINPLALWRVGVSTWFAPRAEIRGATGTQRVDVVRIESVEVGQAKAGPLTIMAHDIDFKDVDGLLGRDFLNHLNVNIDTSAGVVTLTPR